MADLNISEAAQALADKHDFDASGLDGSGKDGKITITDVREALGDELLGDELLDDEPTDDELDAVVGTIALQGKHPFPSVDVPGVSPSFVVTRKPQPVPGRVAAALAEALEDGFLGLSQKDFDFQRSQDDE